MSSSSSVASDLSTASMQKWGIPNTGREGPESSVLERLVWVRYENTWWPAILYRSYLELQQHMYTRFSSYVVKAQFALAIMRQMQEKRNVQVARLLGRKTLEILEIEDGTYREFYWYLADILPEVCDKTNFEGNVELFIDVHRALDEVETIFREVTNDGISLSLDGEDEHRTWIERAQAKLGKQGSLSSGRNRHCYAFGDNDIIDDSSTVDSIRLFRQTLASNEGPAGDRSRSATRRSSIGSSSTKKQQRSLSKERTALNHRHAENGLPGDETRDDLVSAHSSRTTSSQRKGPDLDPLQLLAPHRSGSDVIAEMIRPQPQHSRERSKAVHPPSTPHSPRKRGEMIPKLLEEISKLQKAVDMQKERARRKKDSGKNSKRNKNCIRASSTISSIPSQTLKSARTQSSRAGTEKANNLTFTTTGLEARSLEPLRTSKGRIIPRRSTTRQEHQFQSRNPSSYTRQEAQSLLMEAQQRQKNQISHHDARSDSQGSSQPCQGKLCGLT